jgi:hypothetical protein
VQKEQKMRAGIIYNKAKDFKRQLANRISALKIKWG